MWVHVHILCNYFHDLKVPFKVILKPLRFALYVFIYFSLNQVYRGVRIGGLNMSLKHSQNKGTPHFPHDYPDCPAGLRFQEEQEAELLDKFKRSAED